MKDKYGRVWVRVENIKTGHQFSVTEKEFEAKDYLKKVNRPALNKAGLALPAKYNVNKGVALPTPPKVRRKENAIHDLESTNTD